MAGTVGVAGAVRLNGLLLGLALASLMAAFMSTVSTHINWGASYVANDFYKRFFAPDAKSIAPPTPNSGFPGTAQFAKLPASSTCSPPITATSM